MCPNDIAHLLNDILAHNKPYFFCLCTSLAVTAPALTSWISICTGGCFVTFEGYSELKESSVRGKAEGKGYT